MAKLKNLPAFLDRLVMALVEGLKAGGIAAKVYVEPVPSTKLHRLTVLAPKFAALRPSERQDLVWRIVDDILDREDQLKISMILTLTPDEAKGK